MPMHHVVQSGEALSSIAARYGFAPGTLWDLPENAALRQLRTNGNVLMPGDVLFVPDLRPKTVDAATGVRHQFRRLGVPARFRTRLLSEGAPLPGRAFRLDVDGRTVATGVTDAAGMIDVGVPPGARTGTLVIGDDQRRIALRFSALTPLTEVTGVQQRLRNLGLLTAAVSGQFDAATRAALAQLQRRAGLASTGVLDDATRSALEAAYDRDARLPDPPVNGPADET